MRSVSKRKKYTTGAVGLSTWATASVSVVVPSEPGVSPKSCLDALDRLSGPEKALIVDVLVVFGKNPSAQRNLAVRRARGQWIWFLDSDSEPQRGSLTALFACARALDAQVVGGPNLAPVDEPWPQRAFSTVLASRFGSGASCARYASVGVRRQSTEKELILCNLLLLKDTYLRGGGLREDMYPNEENELLVRLKKTGHGLAYDPMAFVRRPRRASLREFVWQAFRYGRGRARQLLLAGLSVSDLPNLAPSALLVSLFVWPWLVGVSLWAGLPAAIYIFLTFAASLALGLGGNKWDTAFSAVILFPARHFAYGLGLGLGFFSLPQKADSKVRVAVHPWPRRKRT